MVNIPLPEVPTNRPLTEAFTHLMADAMNVTEEEAQIILKL